MTLEELEFESRKPVKPCQSCEEVRQEATYNLPKHVFLMADEEGKTRFMEISEDGRIVPCEEW